ncbi:TetR/AcrR family transcriptional regulator [Terricaulis silvestris]|uniref:Putative HTH-type transcriptional regulator TtgW n=1 Tax=Terricaulis silvestris TaxID=2686094 RepID=A0A6I6MQI3_9CAUL|nr:TetR/AcrR family transcriptional regulator [Terricaulis silvestris]QGZ93812.1 putative HTH-type transcriptional regulator TtgW [Terricaulis silvestris]
MSQDEAADFRTRTGQARRARTRSKILTAAFDLFDARGIEKVTVDDIRTAAGLARGSFYNYFATYEDLLKEMARLIARQITHEQSVYYDAVPDLAERTWSNLRYAILRVASDRPCAEILVRIIPLVGPISDTMRERADRDLARAIDSGAVKTPSPDIALDFGYGVATMMLHRSLQGNLSADDLRAAGLMFLRALGVEEAKAVRIVRKPLPAMPALPLRGAIISAPAP